MAAPIVFLHGAFAGSWSWAPFVDWFSGRGFETHAPDLRHHAPGAAPDALDGVGLDDYLDDLTLLVEGLDEAPVLIGHSLGGLLAQKLASRGLARAVVLLASAPPHGLVPGMGELAARFTLASAGGAFWQQTLRPSYGAARYALERFPAPVRRALFQQMVPESGRALFETLFWELDHRRAAHVPPGRLRVPLLSTIGEQDRVFAPSTARSIAARYPGPTAFHVFPELGHYLIGEPGADTVPAFIEGWIRRATA